MIFLADNDIILKFACLGLQNEFAIWLGDSKVYFLSSLSRQLRHSTKWRSNYGDETLSRALMLIAKFSILDLDFDPAFLDVLNKLPGMDAGEAALFSTVYMHREAVVLTGDKRCLKALASAEFQATYGSALRGRVICFEQILEGMIAAQGFQTILNAMTKFQGCDKTIEIFFSQEKQSSEGNVKSGLQSYINNLKKNAPGILVDDA